MKRNRLFYIPGLFGSPHELDFLKGAHTDISGLDYLSYALEELGGDFLTKEVLRELNKWRPDIIYAYSMGGRILLNILNKDEKFLHFKPKLIILESVGLFPLKGVEREKRLAQDHKRSEEIECNFENFIKAWYSLPIWQFSKEEYEQIWKQKNSLFSKNPAILKKWSKIIRELSPGRFPKDPSNFDIPALSLSKIFDRFPQIHYFAGEKDERYFDIAKRLIEILGKSKDHDKPYDRIHLFSEGGHNLHFQLPEDISLTLKNIESR